MIIKAKMRGQNGNTFWRVFADVSGLAYGQDYEGEFEPAPEDVSLWRLVNEKPEPSTSNGPLILMASFYEGGNPIELRTNQDCFLMTDDGRTIERLC